ncbi:MAG: hypothetical protein ABLT11_11460 [Candidatus Acidiferrum sp.]
MRRVFVRSRPHLLATEALAQIGDPLGQGFGVMGQLQVLGVLCTRGQKSDVVFLIGPVNRDQGRQWACCIFIHGWFSFCV